MMEQESRDVARSLIAGYQRSIDSPTQDYLDSLTLDMMALFRGDDGTGAYALICSWLGLTEIFTQAAIGEDAVFAYLQSTSELSDRIRSIDTSGIFI